MVGPLENTNRCSESGCEQPARGTFISQPFCVGHFFTQCYQKLDEIGRDTRNWVHGGTKWEAARRVTKECIDRAAEISQYESEFSNLERARLLDIKLWAAELGRQLRRSPRNSSNITVRLVSEIPARSWTEDTRTVNVSVHGSQILCNHPVEIGDSLKIFRLDKAAQAEARVVWKGQADAERKEIGVEVLGDKNFWLS